MDHKEEHQRLWQRTIYNTYDKLEHCCWSSVDHHLLIICWSYVNHPMIIICWLSSVVIICRSSVAHHLLIMFLYQILLFCYYENWQGDSRDSVVKTPPPWVRIIKWIVTFSVGICWSSSEDHLLIICYYHENSSQGLMRWEAATTSKTRSQLTSLSGECWHFRRFALTQAFLVWLDIC